MRFSTLSLAGLSVPFNPQRPAAVHRFLPEPRLLTLTGPVLLHITTMLGVLTVGATVLAGAFAAPYPSPPQAVFQQGDFGDLAVLLGENQEVSIAKDGQKWNWTVVNQIDPLKRTSLPLRR